MQLNSNNALSSPKFNRVKVLKQGAILTIWNKSQETRLFTIGKSSGLNMSIRVSVAKVILVENERFAEMKKQ